MALLETLRPDELDGGLDEDETEEENANCRPILVTEVGLTMPLPTREVGAGGAGLAVSPARSASVFRLRVPAGGGIMPAGRALLAEFDNSVSLPGDSIRRGCGNCEVYCVARLALTTAQ